MKRKRLINIIFFLLISVAAVYIFFSWFANQAKQEAALRNLSKASNSIKHAFTAAEVYTFFKTIGLGDIQSEYLTLELGIINEKLEYYLRLPKNRDTTKEIIKDLYNNISGVAAIQICKPNGYKTRLRLVGSLVQKEIIPKNIDDKKIPEIDSENVNNTSDPVYAVEWFNNNRLAIKQNLTQIAENDKEAFCN